MPKQSLAQAFSRRNWEALARSKAEYWRKRKRARGGAEGIRVADDLRRQVLAIRPRWPSPAERAEDLQVHARVAEALRRVARTGRS
jgi:hypothetical protein